jgi:hypothetical protein
VEAITRAPGVISLAHGARNLSELRVLPRIPPRNRCAGCHAAATHQSRSIYKEKAPPTFARRRTANGVLLIPTRFLRRLASTEALVANRAPSWTMWSARQALVLPKPACGIDACARLGSLKPHLGFELILHRHSCGLRILPETTVNVSWPRRPDSESTQGSCVSIARQNRGSKPRQLSPVGNFLDHVAAGFERNTRIPARPRRHAERLGRPAGVDSPCRTRYKHVPSCRQPPPRKPSLPSSIAHCP